MPEAQHRPTGHRVSKQRANVPASTPARALLGARRGLSPSATTSQFFDAGDQGSSSSCVAFVFSRAIKVRAGMLGLDLETPSELALYFVARALERVLELPKDFPDDGELPALLDAGSDPVLAAQGIRELGACASSLWPFDASLVSQEAPDGVLERLPLFTLRGCHPAIEMGPQGIGLNPQEVMQAIDAGFPFPMAIQVDAKFEAYGADSPPLEAADPATIPRDANGNFKGGHMTLLLDYGQEKQWLDPSLWFSPRGDSPIFRGGNSWGKTWGQGGLYLARPSFITAATTSDGFVLDAVPGVVQKAVDRHMAAEQARHDAREAVTQKGGAK